MRESYEQSRFLRDLGRNSSGNVAMIFGLVVIPLIIVMGFAIDFQRTVARKNKVQIIMDSAVIAGARAMQKGSSIAEIKTIVSDYMDAQIDTIGLSLNCGAATINVDPDLYEIGASMLCHQDTSIMQMAGFDDMGFLVESGSTWGIDKLDVAFMFDLSGSMDGNRIANLKSAAAEAVDILLPENADPALVENTRIAMSGYNSMVNAGDYFEAVTGQPATRTYTHEIPALDLNEGDLSDNFELGLYDADTDELISLVGDGAVIEVQDHQDDDLTLVVNMLPSHPDYDDVESIRFNLSGEERESQTESNVPYALYSDSGGTNYHGDDWDWGNFEIRIRGYAKDNAKGSRLFDETFNFTTVEEDFVSEPRTVEHTLTSTCVWGRDGDDAFTDGAPGPGAYLEYQQAWFVEDPSDSDGGDWEVGHPERDGESKYDGDECRDVKPLALTNNRSDLLTYIDDLNVNGWTAGQLGIAWSWYLISENWDGVFTGDSAPLSYDEPETVKAMILMTDGSFNTVLYQDNGNSTEQAEDMCDNLHATGIRVYSVAFEAPESGQDVLEYCASEPEFYFEADSAAELTEAYQAIASSISDLRISH